MELFNEVENESNLELLEPTLESIRYQRRRRTRGYREAMLENLPVETVEYRLSDEEQVCSCCGRTKIKKLDPKDRYEERLKQSKPILDAFLPWLQKQKQHVLPKSALGKAIAYCLNQWDKLVAFLEDGRLEIDNNRSERSIKSVVIGRKNWLFANTPQGARASAIIYSIVETAKANQLNPYYYLRYLFEKLPNMDLSDKNALDQMLPWSTTLPVSCIAFHQLTK